MNLRFPLLRCLLFLWCTPFWRELEPGTDVWEGERRGGLQALVCVVLCSQINLEIAKPFSGSQFCSFLLNRSMQENGELKIESKIEEVSSFPVICFWFFRYVCQFQLLCWCCCLQCGSLLLIRDLENISKIYPYLEEPFCLLCSGCIPVLAFVCFIKV